VSSTGAHPFSRDRPADDHERAAARDPLGNGSTFGLGFGIRNDAHGARWPGSVGSFSGAGLGTYFWVDPAEQLVAVN